VVYKLGMSRDVLKAKASADYRPLPIQFGSAEALAEGLTITSDLH